MVFILRIILLDVKDKNKFINTFTEAGYNVEEGPHTVLLDHSELTSYKVKKDNKLYAVLIIHYITPYYRVELENIRDDNEYLKKLIRIRHSNEKWEIPVNPVITVVLDDSITDLLSNYKDDYPVNDGEELVNKYRSKNPNYAEIPRILLARVLEELGLTS